MSIARDIWCSRDMPNEGHPFVVFRGNEIKQAALKAQRLAIWYLTEKLKLFSSIKFQK